MHPSKVLLLAKRLLTHPWRSNVDGRFPIHDAAEAGHAEAVLYLVQGGSGVDYCTKEDETPLQLAVGVKNVKVVQVLLNSGATIERHGHDQTLGHSSSMSVLLLATESGNVDVVRLLLEHGADPGFSDDDGITACHTDVREGYVELLELLFDAGVDLNSQDALGRTVVAFAAMYRRREAFEWLMSAGADLCVAAGDGRNALDWVSRSPEVFRSVELSRNYNAGPRSGYDEFAQDTVDNLIRQVNEFRDEGLDWHRNVWLIDSILFDLTTLELSDLTWSILVVLHGFVFFERRDLKRRCSMRRRNLSSTASGTWHSCKHCIVVRLCDSCFSKYDEARPDDDPVCKGHEFFSVSKGDFEMIEPRDKSGQDKADAIMGVCIKAAMEFNEVMDMSAAHRESMREHESIARSISS